MYVLLICTCKNDGIGGMLENLYRVLGVSLSIIVLYRRDLA